MFLFFNVITVFDYVVFVCYNGKEITSLYFALYGNKKKNASGNEKECSARMFLINLLAFRHYFYWEGCIHLVLDASSLHNHKFRFHTVSDNCIKLLAESHLKLLDRAGIQQRKAKAKTA